MKTCCRCGIIMLLMMPYRTEDTIRLSVVHSNGDNTGTKLLADCYRYGYGVRRDRKRARELYRQAAENGNDEARKILEKW